MSCPQTFKVSAKKWNKHILILICMNLSVNSYFKNLLLYHYHCAQDKYESSLNSILKEKVWKQVTWKYKKVCDLLNYHKQHFSNYSTECNSSPPYSINIHGKTIYWTLFIRSFYCCFAEMIKMLFLEKMIHRIKSLYNSSGKKVTQLKFCFHYFIVIHAEAATFHLI